MKTLIYTTLIILCLFLLTLQNEIQASDGKTGAMENLDVTGQWFLGFEAGKSSGAEFNQFLLKRGYINIVKNINSSFSARITPDISVDREGDGEGDIELRLKYCYVKYSLPGTNFFSDPFIEFGLVHRPWLDFEEHINRYRVQGTMFLERNRILNSADYGLTFVSNFGGTLDPEYKRETGSASLGKFGSMAIGIYNGGGYHSIEQNKNKTFESRISLRPFHQAVPGLQITYTNGIGKGNIETSPDWTLHSGFLSMEHRRFIFTAMYYQGTGNSYGTLVSESGAAAEQSGHSIFGELKMFSHKVSLFGRYDKFDFDEVFENESSRRFIFGFAYYFYKKSKIVLDFDKFEHIDSDKPGDSVFEFAVEISY